MHALKDPCVHQREWTFERDRDDVLTQFEEELCQVCQFQSREDFEYELETFVLGGLLSPDPLSGFSTCAEVWNLTDGDSILVRPRKCVVLSEGDCSG